MIQIVQGNLLDADDRDIILQQVNCCGVMGSGIAKQIRERYPEIYNSYKYFCDSHRILRQSLLGKVHYYSTPEYVIANCFGQYSYGRDGRQYTDYDALRECFTTVACNKAERIGIPFQIGCGLGGGDWEVVYNMICEIFDGIDVKIYKI